MEIVSLALFCLALLLCVIFDLSVLYALGVGLVVFSAYAKIKKHSFKAIFKMIFGGIKTSKNILINFLLIGLLTASWRESGTIAFIICSASELISPQIFVLMTFVLNALVSFLMGTSFGTSATMGVICMTMAKSMGLNPVIVGGAMLSGALWGDRCSPVSTSALLVSELTKTDIFTNIKNMFRTAAIPTALTCIIYLVLGISSGDSGAVPNLKAMFSAEFNLHPLAVIPAAVILVLSLFRVKTKYVLLASLVSASVLGVAIQDMGVVQTLKTLILGYEAETAGLRHMMNGGGLVSMLNATAIVCISSAYSGIFAATGLLDSLKEKISALGKRITPFGATMITSALTSLISCNQTLAIILTHQLCDEAEKDKNIAAINLENTAVVISPLVPWSIAAAVPLTSSGAPTESLAAAVFLYILPIWSFLIALVKKGKKTEMDRITSFTVDHDLLTEGIYVSRIDGDITTYDLRTRVPNSGDFMDTTTAHTVEHMFATFVRNSEISDDVIYFGPMGCRTGFYLLVRNADNAKILEITKKILADIIAYEGEVFGNTRKECGNYLDLDLEKAKEECRRYLKALEKEQTFEYRA